MSSKKDKLLESAQKFILKGQLDRAVKDYEQIVALDPNDIRHRQRLAELLVRANRKDDAIGEYEAIGKYYADNAYYLKAIAVYKQVQKLDPDNIKISLNLATLNEKQGLTGNALAEYSRVYSHYERSGKRNEALTILESMIAIDPENLNTRLKFAESRFAAGSKDKAYEEFVQLASLLRKRGDEGAFSQVCERVRYLFPDKTGFALELVSCQLNSGEAASAMAALREITNKEQGNLKAWQLLADALATTGDRDGLKSVHQEMARLFPDELSPREGLIQCALAEGDTENALVLLNLHGSLFIKNGAHASVERPYLRLLEQFPEDARLLQGLRKLYEASGEQAKLADVAERLANLTREDAGMGAELREEEAPPVEEVSVSPAEPAEPGPEPAWEEEIDISLPDDCFLGEVAAAPEAPPEQRQQPAIGGETAPDDPEQPAEAELAEPADVPLELELTEDELVDLAELYNQVEMDEPVSPDLPPEEIDISAEEQGPLPGDGGGRSCEVTLFEELDCYELDAEIFTEPEAVQSASADNDKYCPDGLFSAFKKELGQQLDEEDTETHFNLGIAFKEMGLYDDAIAEFRAAAADPRRKLDCVTLQGICCRDRGDLGQAEEILKNGIAMTGMTDEEMAPLKYELALLYEMSDRKEQALHLYHDINRVNPGFRDTAAKIAAFYWGEVEDFDELELVELEGEHEG